jgi:hypothetical protein
MVITMKTKITWQNLGPSEAGVGEDLGAGVGEDLGAGAGVNSGAGVDFLVSPL